MATVPYMPKFGHSHEDGDGMGGNNGDVAEVADRQILRVFDPVVPDSGFESQRQLTAINYLDQALQ